MTEEARIVEGAAGELKLQGVLDYRTGPALLEAGLKLIRHSTAGSLKLDCSGVVKSSSVGLSLVLAFIREARAAKKSLSVRGIPEDMQGIARVSGLLELLNPQA
ncbi:STAS domain-containing protein [Pseudomonas sp. Marseille-Q8238]